MRTPAPHFLLFSDANRSARSGDWKFVLKSADGSESFEAQDAEPATQGERLELLAVVRGLEALDQPSRVTLMTPSRYVNRGLQQGLEEWRENGWAWERHGEMAPVKNSDLWQRVDRALRFHDVECRTWRLDPADDLADDRGEADPAPAKGERRGIGVQRSNRRSWRRLAIACRRVVRDASEALRLRLAQFGTSLLPKPWLD